LISLLNLGSVSDQRAANGAVMAGVKMAKTNNLTNIPSNSKPARSLRKIGSDAPWQFARESQLSAVSVKFGGVVSPVEKWSGVSERSEPDLRSGAIRGVSNRSDNAGLNCSCQNARIIVDAAASHASPNQPTPAPTLATLKQ